MYVAISSFLVVAVATVADALAQLLGDLLALLVRRVVGNEHPASGAVSALLYDDTLVGVHPDDLVAGFEIVLFTKLLRDGRLSLLRNAS